MTQATSLSIAAVRGATSVTLNRADAIRAATTELLQELMRKNALDSNRIVSAFFTATPDLDAAFPAQAARDLGWHDVPLLGAVEMAVPGAPLRLVRVLLTVNGLPEGTRLTPVYLGEAARLRPDLGPTSGHSNGTSHRIALIGLGQIGGSIGLALGRKPGWWRVGFDIDRDVAAEALTRGAVHAVAGSLAEAVRGAELAVVAVPVDCLADVVAEVAAHLPPGAVLIDTGSARGPVTAALRAAAERGLRVVGGHPLAGSEAHGLGAARGDLFHDSDFALCPVEGDPPQLALDFVAALGARPLRVDPETHDAALARTSHLPYLVACALRDVGTAAAERGLAGPAFRGMTRIAAARSQVAHAYCAGNRRNVRAAWRELRARLDRLVAGLGEPNDLVEESPVGQLAGLAVDPFEMS